MNLKKNYNDETLWSDFCYKIFQKAVSWRLLHKETVKSNDSKVFPVLTGMLLLQNSVQESATAGALFSKAFHQHESGQTNSISQQSKGILCTVRC
jgi:hypothetical protein